MAFYFGLGVAVVYSVWKYHDNKEQKFVRSAASRSATEPLIALPAQAAATPPPPAQLKAVPEETRFSEAEKQLMQSILAHFATGDFVSALKLADDAAVSERSSQALHDWLIEQLPVLLTSAGWARLKFGDCEEATTYLRRSEAMKKSPETAKGLAVCFYKLKNLASAREQFTYYLEKQPQDDQMKLLFTDVLESEGRFDDAVRTLESIAAAPDLDATALKQRLDSMRGRAKESVFQQTETSRNFRLAYRSGDHEELVAYVLEALEGALDAYIELFAFQAPSAQIEVNLYPAESFQSIVVGGPEWAEGLFDGRLRIPVRAEMITQRNFSDSLEVVLRHELVHALLAQLSGGRPLPPWFDEGLAQRLSCDGRPCGTFQFEGRPGGFLAEPAFQTPYISLSAINAGRAYRQSLYLVRLLETKGGDDALRRIIQAITPSSRLDSDALLAPVGLSFKDLHQAAAASWQARRLP